ncbi:MAG: S41 family peptidase [Geminicoccaceae bacterium]|jgi:carboxyl-terminal processing protease|nr:S41 family peptidase [Geminicoccaceae bacterium]HRY23238.1 S41 family peptidase [Geminicoccaceae bacterium]
MITGCMMPPPSAQAQSGSGDTIRQLKLFGDVFERVRKEYVEEVTDQELVESAINGMLTSLDPHSGYLDAGRYRDMQVQTRGEFGGLGIEVTMENGLVKVVSPIDDTPAFDAGIQAGDLITHIDGEPVLGLSLSEAVERMRGPVNSEIELKIVRENREEPLSVNLARAIIKISPVRARAEDDIGYVRLTTFNEQTNDIMREEVAKLRDQLGDRFRGLVLDLRNNPGGLLDQAVAVADAYLDQGEIVSTRGRRSESIQRFNARSGDIIDGLPMVVLINGGSASASEIVAGALQDHRRSIIMGTQSFGKGSVQTIMPISGEGAIRLTTARYYTPSGTSIQAKGIAPDIEVHQATIELQDDTSGRREADLRGRLDGEQPGDQAASGEAEPTLDSTDYQLARAIDVLRGIALYEARATQRG